MAEQNENPPIESDDDKIKYQDIVDEENKLLAERRRIIYGEEDAQRLDQTKFGLALSGGGIRSAVVNLGILKTLNCFDLVKRADYISTVSGGGYTGAYIQGTLRNYKNYKKKDSHKKFETFQDYQDFKTFQFNDDFQERYDYQDYKAFNPEGEALEKYLEYTDYAHYLNYANYKRYVEFQGKVKRRKELDEKKEKEERKKRKKKKTQANLNPIPSEVDDFNAYLEFMDYHSLNNDPDFERDEAFKRFESNTTYREEESYSEVLDIIDCAEYKTFLDNKKFKDYPAYREFINFKNSPAYLDFLNKSKKHRAYRSFIELEKYQKYQAGKNSDKFKEFKHYQDYRAYLENENIDYSKIKGYIAYNELFTKEHADYMRSRGEYLFPGTGWRKVWNQFVLVVSYTISLLMSWVGPAIMIILGAWLIAFIGKMVDYQMADVTAVFDQIYSYREPILYTIGGILGVHYLFNLLASYHLSISSKFSHFETVLFIIALLAFLGIYLVGINGVHMPEDIESVFSYLLFGVLLIVLGFIANPNATSLHRFYRAQLSKAFLHFAGNEMNVPLQNMSNIESDDDAKFIAPYPLINTCLNLQSTDDKNFNGTKTSDYFLLSPLYSGAKLTGYVSSKDNNGYNTMTLPAAVTISAAAVNPGMGIYSNKILSILTTVLNFRLGYWTWNPLKIKKSFSPVWWPFYFLYELFSRIGTDKNMLNISDGGHIENLGVYELLRRRCRLIIAIDAGADPNFNFSDLNNLTIRARNELGIDIRFRDTDIPEDVMRPKPSHGYSEKRYCVADLYCIWEKVFDDEGNEEIVHYEDNKVGTLVYIKSTVTAPQGRPEISKDDELRYGTYKYKIYHPEFPHESTADQFFDPIQWESYYQLGQHIAADVLNLDNWEHYAHNAQTLPLDILFDDFNVGFGQEEEVDEIEIVDRGISDDDAEPGVTCEEEEKIVKKEVYYKM